MAARGLPLRFARKTKTTTSNSETEAMLAVSTGPRGLDKGYYPHGPQHARRALTQRRAVPLQVSATGPLTRTRFTFAIRRTLGRRTTLRILIRIRSRSLLRQQPLPLQRTS